jgi:uncharacterized membrane protein
MIPFKASIQSAWEAVRTSYWFVPGGMAVAAILLSYATVELDHLLDDAWEERAGWLYTGSAEAARELLTTIAGSMIATAGVVFSITMVTLTLAANQFGSRMLRNFMRDLSNQVVLGTFLAAFLYCLLILRNVHAGNDAVDEFIPQLSLVVAVLLAVAGVGVLIFFIHHVSVSIQSPNVVAAVAREFREAIDQLYPTRMGSPPSDAPRAEREPALPADFDRQAVNVPADHDGHLERVDAEQLFALARDHDLVLRMCHRPGQFVEYGEPILQAWPGSRVEEKIAQRLQETFTVRRERSLSQDAEFAIVQLVEVAVRALSPSTNDPFTAMLCVDYLGANLGRLAERVMPAARRVDDAGQLRVVAPSLSLAGYVDAAFAQIRHHSRSSPAVLLRMLEVFERLGRRFDPADEAARACLAAHARMVFEQLQESAAHQREHDIANRRYTKVMRALEPPAA